MALFCNKRFVVAVAVTAAWHWPIKFLLNAPNAVRVIERIAALYFKCCTIALLQHRRVATAKCISSRF